MNKQYDKEFAAKGLLDVNLLAAEDKAFREKTQYIIDKGSLFAEAEEVFGKLPAEPSTDAPMDQARDAALREVCSEPSAWSELIRVGRDMRRWQKRFSKAGSDKEERKLAFSQALLWEKQFDALIAPKDEKQLDMFDDGKQPPFHALLDRVEEADRGGNP